MEVSEDKKNTRIYLDIIPLFYHMVSKLVQALVIIHYEIFQALAAGGNVLLPQSFLDQSLISHSPEACPLKFHVFGKLNKHIRGRQFPSDDTVKADV
jgi:hypothetical protein